MLDSVYRETEEKMKKAVRAVKNDFKTVRTGRATPDMFEGITVDYYGSPTPLNQLAKIQILDAKQVVIKPYDKGSLEDIEKGILDSDLGLTPNNDGNIIRINMPDLTGERREELRDVVKGYVEEGKIALRKIRREARDEIDLLESEGEISEDDAHRARENIQDIISKYEDLLEDMLDKKTEEIMSF